MKARAIRICFTQLVFLLLFTKASIAQTQGKLVINEYMSWPAASCGTTGEFVELLNFGPGPVDISCYILTTGVYSVTIPNNTIIKPGEFYIIAGQNFIPGTCANIDSTASGVTADLNWNTCNCTNVPIPTTGDGMMKDGGSSNTPLVLLDPSLKIVDAIVRNTPTEPVGPVTSATVPGSCTGQTFNIGTMNPVYEVLGMSAGRGNTFSRTLDGDCNWLKDPQQSGNASNNRGGRVTDISYEFDMVNPTSCEERKGSVSIYVKHSDYDVIFPMSYTIVMDSDNNGVYDFNDEYSTYTDNEPPFVEIEDLPVGRFRVTLASTKGCYLRSFDFPVISCEPNTLPVRLLYFKSKSSNGIETELEWLLQDVKNLQSIVVEKGTEGGRFVATKVFVNEQYRGDKIFSWAVSASPDFQYYRLKITQKSGQSFYSPVIHLGKEKITPFAKIWPNPALDKLHLELHSPASQHSDYSIYNINGLSVLKGRLSVSAGKNSIAVPVESLPPGVYQLQIANLSGSQQPISIRFVKH